MFGAIFVYLNRSSLIITRKQKHDLKSPTIMRYVPRSVPIDTACRLVQQKISIIVTVSQVILTSFNLVLVKCG